MTTDDLINMVRDLQDKLEDYEAQLIDLKETSISDEDGVISWKDGVASLMGHPITPLTENPRNYSHVYFPNITTVGPRVKRTRFIASVDADRYIKDKLAFATEEEAQAAADAIYELFQQL